MERGFLVQQFISNNIWHRHLHISIFTFLPPLKTFYQLWTSSVQIKFCGTREKKIVHTICTATDQTQHPNVAVLTWKKRSVWVLGWEGGCRCRADGRHVTPCLSCFEWILHRGYIWNWEPVKVPSTHGKGLINRFLNCEDTSWWFLQGEDP